MVVSKPLYDTLEILSCPICSETFKSPKILPCLHTFCEPCIHEFIISTGRKKDNKMSEFACPICRTIVIPLNSDESIEKWTCTLQDNATIATIIALSTGDTTQECHACKRWNEKSDAKFWCKICEEALCKKCNQMHNRMKLLSAHVVIEIEEYGLTTSGIDLNAISNQCPMHPSKELEIFCCRHRVPCCVLCLLSKHIECTGLKPIEEVFVENNDYEALPEKLGRIKDATIKLLTEKEQHKSDFIKSTETVEEEAAKFAETIKCNIDNLFEMLKKQLHIFRDEQNTNFNVRIRLLEQFVKSLEHWISVTKIVKELGSNTQLFVHVETTRSQIKASIIELNKKFQNENLITLNLKRNERIEQLQTAEILGTLEQTKELLVDQTLDIFKVCKDLGVFTCHTFEELSVKKLNTFSFKGSAMRCGVYISDKYIVVGDGATEVKLHMLDKHTGAIIDSKVLTGDIKRLCYDSKFNQVFISCYFKNLYVATIHENTITTPQKIAFRKEYVGALFSHNEFVFLVVPNAIRKFVKTFNPDNVGELTHCFSTNTENGLDGMNIHDDDIIFTTKNKEIKRATLEGQTIYCYQNKTIVTPECLAVLPSGLVLFVDRNYKGSLHVLSADGTKHRTLLENFGKIENPKDIWLDVDKETIYIAGGEYIEVYCLY
ncbi:tripartite motif-containing protein 45-like [Mytilus californianus]|uniref:tripartite motif-containing protein 45-like n=1 Tax=Mytilus californianus TaxID=6549 RepID=UPI002245056E|nr:tripartite motif-containing protein 45-like [Mytilus californianus]